MRTEGGRDLDGTFPAADNEPLGDEPGARERGINHRSLRPEPAVDADRAVDLVGFHDDLPVVALVFQPPPELPQLRSHPPLRAPLGQNLHA